MSLISGLVIGFFATSATLASPRSSASVNEAPMKAPLTAEAFTDLVLAHNASLEAMRQAVLAAVGQVKPAGSLDDPTLSVSAAPRTVGTAGGPSGEVEVSQSFPWWGTLDARREVARANAEAAGQDFDALRLRLASLARGAFADWAYVHRALEINAANQSVLTELRNVARIRYTTGQAPQEDVLQADVERAMLKQQRLEWERDLTVTQARMNALLDRPPRAEIPGSGELPSASALPAEEILARRALAHPQLEELAAEERAAQARQQLAEKERFPKFGVSAGYNSMWADPAMRPMVGLSITVPLDQGKYRAAIDAAHAEARRAASTLEDQRASLLADLSADYASVREAQQSVALYRDELVPLARSTLEVARAEYGSGRGDFLNVLTAEQHRLDTELALARMQSQYFRALAELDRASGGGLLEPRSALTADPIP
ncbi:MAG TPA: TolC family protein [Steroidobacteraceae bacterium]|nr:TolC family protein [Steroidobacteraceae bacterium]